MGVVFRGPDGSGFLECSKRFQFSLTTAVIISVFQVLKGSILVFTPITGCEVAASELNLTWHSQVLDVIAKP